jgi:hypothetical protein
MRKLGWPLLTAALAITLVPGAGAAEMKRPVPPRRMHGPPLPPGMTRVHGPHTATAAGRSAVSGPAVTVKVASSSEATRPTPRTAVDGNARGGAQSAQPETGRAAGKQRSVTVYFVHGEEKQSIMEFSLPVTETAATGAQQRAMYFEANSIEADVDGKLLLRGDVRIRFSNGIRLGAQLVAVTTSRDEGPVEIVVKE